MAIVFISPKEKQRVFFGGLAVIFIVFLMVISLVIFLPDFLNRTPSIPPEISFTKPDVTINLNTLDSDKVKNLMPFNQMETRFVYTVQDQKGKEVTGTISAATQDSAKALLEASGFKVINLKEMSIGRNDPFVSY